VAKVKNVRYDEVEPLSQPPLPPDCEKRGLRSVEVRHRYEAPPLLCSHSSEKIMLTTHTSSIVEMAT